MARQTDIRLRRSAVSGSVPTTSNLNLGELALNTADGKVYMKKSVGGVDSIVEVGSGAIASSFIAYEYTATSNQTTFSGSDNYSNSLAYNTGTPPAIQVFMNGILLDEGSSADYTATNGTSVVLTTGADAGDLIQIHAYKSDVNVVSNLSFGDNQKVQFGDSNDLQIFHDGSHSRIKDTGTGNLILNTQAFRVNGADDAEGMIKANQDGNVELYYNGSKKLETTNTGVQTTGTLNVNGAYTLPTSDGSSGQALVSDGSGTLSFATVSGGAVTSMSDADGDTKIQVEESSDEDKIRFDANGVEIVRMGFNSSSESTLEIVRNGVPAAQGQLTFNGSGLSTNVTSGYHSLIVTNGSSEHLRVRSNGNVGIGSSSPDYKLEVVGNTMIGDASAVTSPGFAARQNIVSSFQHGTNGVGRAGSLYLLNTNTNGESGFLSFGAYYNNTNNLYYQTGGIGGGKETAAGSGWGGYLSFWTTSDGTAGAASGQFEHMRINADGAVGIGTTSPAGPLHVKSSSNKTLILDATITGSSLTSLAFQRSGADKWRILQQSNDSSLLFYNDISSINQLSLRSNGNIGIGEISPDTTLHLTAANPAITLQESDTSTDFNKTEFQSSGGTLLFNTREEDGTFVSTDYAIGKNANGATSHTWSIAGSAKVQLDSSYFDIESGGFRVDDPGNNYPFVVSAYGYMTTRSSSITQLNATDHANVPLSILADVASTRTANYMSVGDIGSAGNRFVIDEVGNVGIGATNPALQSAGTGLHINASAHSEIKFTNSTTGTGASDGTALVATGSGFQINNREAGSILLRTSNTTAVTIDSAQNTAFAGNITTSGSISSGNITTTGYIRGPSTFTIDPAAHGDNTGTLVIAGNLQVDGTTTTINSTTLTVDDKNITLASGSADKSYANGAGITVDCGSDTDARISYTSATDEWDINKSIHVSGAAGSGVKINSGGAIVGGGATGGDTQLMYWGGGPVYYGRSSAGGTVSGHEFRVGGVTKLNVNSSGNTIASGTVSVLGGEIFLGTADSSSGHINAFENMSFNIDSDNDDTNRFFEWNVNGNSGSGTELMRLTEDGKLGIGVSPAAALHIGNAGHILLERGGELRSKDTGGAVRTIARVNGSNELQYGWSSSGAVTFMGGGSYTEKMRIHTNGNIGIGDQNPQDYLEINGSGKGLGGLTISNSTHNHAALSFARSSSATARIYASEPNATHTGQLNFQTSDASGSSPNLVTAMVIADDQNVGIGNTNPAATLEVGTLTSGSTGNVIINSEGGNPPALQVKSRTNRARINIQDNDTSGYIIAEGSVISIGFADQVSDNNININSSHDVGIGTDTPIAKLHIQDNTSTVYDPTAYQHDLFIEKRNTSGNNQVGTIRFGITGHDGSTTAEASIGVLQTSNAHSGNIVFGTRHSGTRAERMRISSDGIVGIGTNSPAAGMKLHVNGAVRVDNSEGIATRKIRSGYFSSSQNLTLASGSSANIIMEGQKVGIGNSNPQAKLQVEVLGVETNQSSVTSTNQFECEAMSATVFRSARYTVQVTNVTDSTYQITEILLIHDGTTPSITEYGTIYTGSAAEASFDAEIANGNVRLLATPASSDNMQFKVVRHSILV